MIDIIDSVDIGNIGRELYVIPSKIERVVIVRVRDPHGDIYASACGRV